MHNVKNVVGMVLVMFLSLTLWGCYKQNARPAGTIASLNFLEKGLVVIDKNGKRVMPVKDSRPGKVTLEGTVRFRKVNPCYVEFCFSSRPCELYLVSEGACPAGF